MNDDELRNLLSRRSAASLTQDERNALLRAARMAVVQPRRRSFVPRIAGWVAGVAAVLVLVILVAPVLLSPPLARSSPTAVGLTSPGPSASPSPAGGIKIFSAQELADLVGDPAWIGKTVLAQTAFDQVDFYGQCPPPDEPCLRGALHGIGKNSAVLFGWRDAVADDGVRFDDGGGYRWVKQLELPTQSGVYVFTVRDVNSEYLGRARLIGDKPPLAVTDLQGDASDPTDSVFLVSAMLTQTLPAPCAFPQEGLKSPMPDISSYYCSGSWLTDTTVDTQSNGPTIVGGLHVQNGAYDEFAPYPHMGSNGYEPRLGVYAIRNAGCPEVVSGDCPVWRMVGRVDDPSTTPDVSPIPVSPPPTPPTSGVHTYTAQELANMVGDPHWVGQTVLAAINDIDLMPKGCPQPEGTSEDCTTWWLFVGTPRYLISIGERDATAEEGVQVDDGNGYRWVERLEPPATGLLAFTIGNDNVEYLGPAYLTPGGEPVTVADIQGISSTMPSDGVIAVDGWLLKNWPPPPCAAPPELLESPQPALDFYCYGTWLTPTPDSGLDPGVRVQNDAYETFAAAPSEGANGVDPQHGVYLVRNAGCPVQAPCPAWRMVGRLDSSQAPQATPTSNDVQIQTAPPADACDDALLTGELVADPEWGLAVRPADGDVVGVVWPYGYGAARQPDDRIELYDETGNIRATTTDTVFVGGGLNVDGTWNACGDVEVAPASPGPPPSLNTSLLYINNGTTLELSVAINGEAAGSAPAGAISTFDPTSYASPWHVTIATTSGRQLVDLTYQASDVVYTDNSARGPATRVDLSCGRLDVYAGPPLLGPGPPSSFPPHDCDP